MFYVYRLIDPRTGQPFYIGKGKGLRIIAHEREARKGIQSKKCDRIREIWAEGLQVVKETVKYFPDEKDAYAFEREIIVQLGIGTLTNIIGGSFAGTKIEGIPDAWAKPLAVIVRKLSRFERVFLLGVDVTDKICSLVAEQIKKFGLDYVRAALVKFDADLDLIRLRTAR